MSCPKFGSIQRSKLEISQFDPNFDFYELLVKRKPSRLPVCMNFGVQPYISPSKISGKFRRKPISGSAGVVHRYTCFPWIKRRSSRPLFTMKTTLKCRFHVREHRVKICWWSDRSILSYTHSKNKKTICPLFENRALTAVHYSWSCDFNSWQNHLNFVPMCP
jgi:hypothetical protein